MKKPWKIFFLLIILCGYPLMAWSGYYIASETYAFWRHGVEKSALVVSLDDIRSMPKTGTTFYYTIEVDGQRLTKEFHVRLPVGRRIAILALPEEPGKLTLGNRDSSLFDIFSYLIGGKVMAVLVISMFAFLLWAGPGTLPTLIRLLRETINE